MSLPPNATMRVYLLYDGREPVLAVTYHAVFDLAPNTAANFVWRQNRLPAVADGVRIVDYDGTVIDYALDPETGRMEIPL